MPSAAGLHEGGFQPGCQSSRHSLVSAHEPSEHPHPALALRSEQQTPSSGRGGKPWVGVCPWVTPKPHRPWLWSPKNGGTPLGKVSPAACPHILSLFPPPQPAPGSCGWVICVIAVSDPRGTGFRQGRGVGISRDPPDGAGSGCVAAAGTGSALMAPGCPRGALPLPEGGCKDLRVPILKKDLFFHPIRNKSHE